jgi:hypothetical protein
MTYHFVCGYSFRSQGIPFNHPTEGVGEAFNNLSFRTNLTWRKPR